jgi:hypothetical protein
MTRVILLAIAPIVIDLFVTSPCSRFAYVCNITVYQSGETGICVVLIGTKKPDALKTGIRLNP